MFEKYVAIDWSGARRPRLNQKIQIAEYDPETRTVSLVPSHTQSATGWNKWSRDEVFEYVRCLVAEKRVLIGFDFAFGYPYCCKDTYFGDCDTAPTNVQDLWATVEQVCKSDDNFRGQRFYTDENSPFKDYYNDGKTRGVADKARYRVTDKRARTTENLTLVPSSSATVRKMWEQVPLLGCGFSTRFARTRFTRTGFQPSGRSKRLPSTAPR